MELWLVRHGTTGANLEGRIQGTLEYPLSQTGRKEALLLAHRLKKRSFSLFFSSNLLRARQTSRIIASVRKGPLPIYLPLLQEYHWGVIQGLTKKEIGEQYPHILKRLQEDFHHAAIPGAEGLEELFRRVKTFCRFLFRLEQRNGFSLPVLIVSHGRFLQAFVLYFLKYDSGGYWPFPFSPASLTILDGDLEGKRRLKLFNDTCHLKNKQEV
ncbi:MAG: histidine phosphatase family protein [Dethiobacter sp.]|jgi:broad specificity phosphatase PhoE|nr:MAG: histidine phosphatase family protein [Dethiobacter sp.]